MNQIVQQNRNSSPPLHEAERFLRNPDNPHSLYVRYNGSKRRLFINDKDGPIGIIQKGKKRSGIYFNNWAGITKIYYETQNDEAENQRKLVLKYKREAALASFTNPFIRKCLDADENKCLYNNDITTGIRNEGEVITLKAIKKWAGDWLIEEFRKALKDKRPFSSGRFNFRGYDGSLQIVVAAEDGQYYKAGDVMGNFNKEFRNCGNGYYYLLINDDKFIAYDID